MPSKLWTQSYEEVARSPFDYESQNQFLIEAQTLLNEIFKLFDRYQLNFHTNDRSLKKALWMLQIDALDTLRDCIELLGQRKHRIVGKMFRDIIEKLDLASLFVEKGENDRTYLDQWYNGKIIQHQKYRDHLGSRLGPEISKRHAEFYGELSQWTHPTYFALGNSYTLGADGMLVYDSHSEYLVPAQTISQYMWMISMLIDTFVNKVEECGLITADDINAAWAEATN